MKLSNTGLEKRETASYRHACACVSARVRMCMPLSHCGETPGGSTASCRTEGQLVEGQEKHKARRGTAPPPESRPSVLNPSSAFVPRPGKCGGEGR